MILDLLEKARPARSCWSTAPAMRSASITRTSFARWRKLTPISPISGRVGRGRVMAG
jgi:hypothetical protein